MSGKPEVSVVMSVYNGAENLSETLDSVLSQDGCDFELIVVNDGSTDETGRILDARASGDDRIRVFHQENTGLTRALIRGCSVARGEFIARQDAGDISLPGRLSRQVRAFQNDNDLAFVSCITKCVGPGGEYLYESSGTGIAITPINIIDAHAKQGILDGPSHHGSVMFRKDKYQEVGGYREQFYYGQDWDLWYRLGMVGKFQLLPYPLYQARFDIGSISASNRTFQTKLSKLSAKAFKKRLQGDSDADVLRDANRIRPQHGRMSSRTGISAGCYFLGECLRRNGDLTGSRSYLLRAVRNSPMNVRAWVRLAQIELACIRTGFS